MYLIKDFLFFARLIVFNQTIRNLVLGNGRIQMAASICIVLIGGCIAFPLSFMTKSNVLIGLVLIPFVLTCNGQRRFNFGYLLGMIVFGALVFHYNIRIGYFFVLAFFILFVVELIIGKTGVLILFLLVFMSPVFEQVAVIIGFPIRLQLTAWAGEMLSYSGLNIRVDGNMMILNGSTFSVDDACMGLTMLAFSMLMGVFTLAYQCRVQNKRAGFIRTLVFFLAVFILNVGCNLFRIMILVTFQIGPEDPMHEATGVICFIVYVMIPMYFLSRWPLIPKINSSKVSYIEMTRATWSSVFGLSVLILLIGIRISVIRSEASGIPGATLNISGYRNETMKDGITKLYNNDVLVYVKPIPEFFTSEHTPLFCWRGTGYQFESIRKVIVDNHEIYAGQLKKPGQVLFTAWWYTNGTIQTVGQLNWRSRMLMGEPRFCLINVTADSETTLLSQVKVILNKKPINIREK